MTDAEFQQLVLSKVESITHKVRSIETEVSSIEAKIRSIETTVDAILNKLSNQTGTAGGAANPAMTDAVDDGRRSRSFQPSSRAEAANSSPRIKAEHDPTLRANVSTGTTDTTAVTLKSNEDRFGEKVAEAMVQWVDSLADDIQRQLGQISGFDKDAVLKKLAD